MENNKALSRMQENLRREDYYMAVENAVEVFDSVEATIRSRINNIEKHMDLSICVVCVLFLFALEIVIPHLPNVFKGGLAAALYILFIAYLLCFPALKYWIPKWIPASYLFRKELFIHKVMDLFHMPIDPPVLVATPVHMPLLYRWGKVRIGNAAIARAFAPVVWIFADKNPFQEIQNYEKTAH